MHADDPHRTTRKKSTRGLVVDFVRRTVSADDTLVRSRTGRAKNMSHDVAATAT